MKQQLQYQIFVIEQYGTDIFNKGRLFNAGFKEVQRLHKFQCVVFHDLDLLPGNREILYTCPTLPRHMCSVVDDTEKSYKFKSLFGGVVSMTLGMFERANGYSNLYFGWGGEDNDMFWRLRAAGFPVVRYNKTVGVFLVLPHTRAAVNEFRFHLLVRAVERYKIEGLSNLEFEVKERTAHRLYTHIVVDINPRKENVTELNLRWTSGDNAF
ncbi:beta-1,4-N-acetylgalactosaminyltransferase bre-4-like [Anticarsia gemmatalis]|uniref:beta-1,4-N-acetylgalactosaminyltransferase bre-4-like n=1 Tax=Anticarsia gemmatalis TaxID=129554 RepID=UPI003F759BFF